MGADRYSECVRCVRAHLIKVEEETANVSTAYGVVPVEEFDGLRARLAEFIDKGIEQTFVETWEIVTPEGDGELRFIYSGRCSVCGLAFKLDQVHDIESQP